MPVCQVCQHDNPAGAEFCEECGAALTPASGPGAAPADASQPASPGPVEEVAPPADDAAEPMSSSPGEPVAADTQPSTGAEETAGQPTGGGTQDARLVAIRFGAPSGEEIPLLGQRLIVGRFDPETGPVDIDLSSAAESGHISRQHAELYLEDGQWVVRDLGSTNGVFVKGSGDTSFGPRITAPRPLSEGDEVAFGNSRFVFRTG